MSRNFLRGIMWGGLIGGMGLTYLMVRDQKKREKVLARGEDLKEWVKDTAEDVWQEGRNRFQRMDLEEQIPAALQDKLKRLETDLKSLEKRLNS